MDNKINHDICISPERLEKIKEEFERGFKFICEFKNTVTFFGSSRFTEKSPHYKQARLLAKKLAENEYGVVTGGGPGIMKAANQGALEGGGRSIGISIELPNEQEINKFVKEQESFYYFFTRKVILSFAAQAYIFFPGGYGTLDEFFEIVTLIQTKKIHGKIPVILIGRDYWGPLCSWIETVVLKKHNAINSSDLTIWTLTDDIDEAINIIKKSPKRKRF